MTEESNLLWLTKLVARLHDPVEKTLILMRTREGHEGGTSATLRSELGLNDLPGEVTRAVRKADHWASAADRAAFPNRDGERGYPKWQQVRFDERPVIIHPLTGQEFEIAKLTDVQPEQAKALALDHFRKLMQPDDFRKTALAFWRFGPQIDADEIKNLWTLLPADTRVPDHTIHDHLDLTAALATCFTAGTGGPALLAVSLGPVQEFIASARSTSDLWSGSHLLSRLAWEAMKVVCKRLGPEAILFPRLRGVPQVDLWLRNEMGLREDLFDTCDWHRSSSDANPLFAAALPNRFTALVPAAEAGELAEEITTTVRAWVRSKTRTAFKKLLEASGTEDDKNLHAYQQIDEQVAGFPEVHWAAVPWSLAATDDAARVKASDSGLAEAMQPFFETSPPGYLGSQAWELLSGGIKLQEGWFWKPNPGTLYPALHELLARVLAASKGLRSFDQARQTGWRDSLSGEAEWLTTDANELNLPSGQRIDTIWTRVAENRPTWAKPGEHLGALNTLKRLWPTLFVEELGELVEKEFNRFVVSTHTMAIAGSIANALQQDQEVSAGLRQAIATSRAGHVALPRKLATALREHADGSVLKELPAWLESAHESADERVGFEADKLLTEYLGRRPESYYSMILMDGDRMGAWLSADPELSLPHKACYHPQIQSSLAQFREDPNFLSFTEEKRRPSPSRHMAISEALNHFSLRLAPWVVEQQHHGRVLYAGGDDLMAMLPVIDLLPTMARLRAAYSGIDPTEAGGERSGIGFASQLEGQANGFVLYRKELLRLMGDKATASCGAVVAHHQAPLGAVLRELRTAEKRAKEEGGRNAFSIAIVKRSGGALRLTARWGEPLLLLNRLRNFLAEPDVSRRAVYNSAVWLRDLPEPEDDGEMAATLLAYQLKKQTSKKSTVDHHDLAGLARRLVSTAIESSECGHRREWIENLLSVAEFLARESRNPDIANKTPDKENVA